MMRVPSETLAATLAALLVGFAALVALATATARLGIPAADASSTVLLLAVGAGVATWCAVALLWRAATDDL